MCIDNHFLGKTAPAGKTDYPVPHLHRIYLLAHLFDNSRDLASGYKRHRRLKLVFSLDNQGVREVYSASLDRDHNLSLPGAWCLDILDHQAFRWPIYLA